jgi:glycerophosphoryl diester phosphodiesterase
VIVLAHRGASDARLENTLPAFTHAIERGADGVELDVQLSRDGEVIVFHDDDLARLAGRYERVEHLGWDELSRVLLRGSGRIPRLIDLLDVWPTDRWLNVELKAGGAKVARETVRLLAGRPRVILSSFDPRMLLAARAAGSGYDHALLLAAESPPFLHAGGAQAFDCASVHLDHRLCTPATIRRYHDQGLQVGVWTVNAAARKQTLAGWGVERIITDCP